MNVVAIVHPTSLLGKELRERLEARPDFCRELRLLSNDEAEVGTLTEVGGAAAIVGRLEDNELIGADVVFFCGAIERDRQALAALAPSTPAIVLSRGAAARDGLPAVAGIRTAAILGRDRLVSPHPAAIGLALLLDPLGPLGVRRAVATALVPVSGADDGGLDELFEQTRSILAFSGNPKGKIFPAQIAFNLLPAAGDAAEIARTASAALGTEFPISLQLVQGGVFHSLALSVLVEVEQETTAAELRQRLARSSQITAVRDPRRLGPVAAAGEEKLLLGEVRAAGEPGAFWIWAALDNLVRGGAANALALAETLLSAGAVS
jgi:aspartate-semialdehyde dehydrogenase